MLSPRAQMMIPSSSPLAVLPIASARHLARSVVDDGTAKLMEAQPQPQPPTTKRERTEACKESAPTPAAASAHSITEASVSLMGRVRCGRSFNFRDWKLVSPRGLCNFVALFAKRPVRVLFVVSMD